MRIVRVTAVVPVPVVMVAGLNTHVLNDGKPEQAKLTGELKAPLPIGAAENA